MKNLKTLTLLSLLAMASTAQAIVVDRFECTVAMLRDGNLVASMSQTLEVARHHFDYPRVPGRIVSVSYGQFPLELSVADADLEYGVHYRQALQLGPVGLPMRAASWSCIELKLETSNGQEIEACIGEEDREDPFGVNDNWQPAELRGGIARFPGNWVAGASVANGAYEATVHCTFLDTTL